MIESQGSAIAVHVLVLGGTTEASQLARLLAAQGLRATFSYAGRTETPIPQPLPTRIGGFGGARGLADHLRQAGVTHLVDATHPFAAQISRNAIEASALASVPLVALERPAWTPGKGDDWRLVPDLESAALALPEQPARVFLAIGKQNLASFAIRPQHHYLLRLVDPPLAPALPQQTVILARGPFDVEGDLALLREHCISHVVAKNSGGAGASAKLAAARRLGLPVIMVQRPDLPPRQILSSPEAVMAWLLRQDPAHPTFLGL